MAPLAHMGGGMKRLSSMFFLVLLVTASSPAIECVNVTHTIAPVVAPVAASPSPTQHDASSLFPSVSIAGGGPATTPSSDGGGGVTYLQAAMMPGQCAELVGLVEDTFGADELVQHLEVVRFGGRVGFASLALLMPKGAAREERDARLEEILRWHDEAGIHVFNPHTHVLEDGGMKETDWAQLGFKAGADPAGVLNPGKMRAWEEKQATTETSDPKGSFSAAYRLAQAGPLPPGALAAAATTMMPTTTTAAAAAAAGAKVESADSSGGGSLAARAPYSGTAAKAPPPRSRQWAEWTTADFASADLSDAVAVLPLGACEAHGPHLPLGVDSMHNQGILAAALRRLPPHVTALALPPLDVGVSCEHSGFAGTVGMKPETAAAVWTEVGACVARAGIRKIVLYNSHGGNHALAEVVARRLRLEHDMVAVLALNLGMDGPCAEALFPGDELRWGIHGGGLETSVMLHLRPELVDMTQARRFESSAAAMPRDGVLQKHAPGFGVKAGWLSQDLNPAGVVGDAADADAERGRVLVEAAADALATLLLELHATDAAAWTGNTPLFPPQGPPASRGKSTKV
eukprot:CAMPEP_0197583006 /NCGR_PEP_ID=MMETSP1326-20131121/6048_1 /TAXON_ID=1155430 /ORGANISM="Genus nov. species nov., Strain RCC2288" /LENGTH=572 /DNA_ID=CAMNT_0043147165 /DNA_START=446 /DNA_END=2164 /DNA_ORIENTATION=-